MVDSPTIDLSLKQARKLALLSQGLHQQNSLGQGLNAAHKAVEQLGYVQIDTISVVERAHHHTLWNRLSHYKKEQLDDLVKQRKVFEYWSHAAAYLPMSDYRFSLVRKHAIASGKQRWHIKDNKIAKEVLSRIQSEGPLQAKDFEHARQRSNKGWWDWKPAKIALEQLFMEGELMVSRRQGFQKVYDLTENVIPAGIDTRMPNQEEFLTHLAMRYLAANGIGTTAQMSYLRRGLKAAMHDQCNKLCEQGSLTTATVNGQSYFCLRDTLEKLSKPLSHKKVAILSPFDNVLIQRKRILELFDFDYQIECYLPAAKRKFGYFSLPLLWGQSFVGRLDAKIDRKTGVLKVLNLSLQTDKAEQFVTALKSSLMKFLKFNGGSKIEVQKISSIQCRAKQKSLNELKSLLTLEIE